MDRRPNILFFFTDDQRYDTIAALGNSEICTPNQDRLAARGIVFTHAHIPGGTTGAVCMPSRAMLHSGRTLFHIDDMGQQIPEDHATLGETFRNAGYETYGIGKWHNGRSAYARSFTGGDEIFFGGMEDHWNVPAYRFDPTGSYSTKCPYIADPYHSKQLEWRDCDHIEAGKHSTDLFSDAAIDFIEQRNRQNPFFLYVSLMAPHDPRTMPEKYLKMYPPDNIRLPQNFLTGHPIDTGALKVRDELLAAFPREPAEIRRHIADYYAMITHLDDALGRVIATLEKTGELDNTIIVFSGDNGLAVGRHGLMGKQNLYDHSVRVPLLFAGPGIPEGKRSDALVYLLDIFPTLCDLAGIDTPGSVEGKSLMPCMNGADKSGRDMLYLAYADSIRGVTDGQWKLIEYSCGATQLFDLPGDPHEIDNIAHDTRHSATLQQMRTTLRALADEWDDQKHSTGSDFWAKRSDLA